jgi:hypothetical protein
MKFIKSIVLIVFIFIQNICFAQTPISLMLKLNAVGYIALAPDNLAFSLEGTSYPQAGGGVSFTYNTLKYINFTSAVNLGVTRTITAQITSGSIPSGMSLKLTITPASGMVGTRGTNVSSINLSGTQQVIVSGIGGSYTGLGSGYGYNLKFELVISDYSQLRSGSTSLSITFSIT